MILESILIVDDEPEVRASLQEALQGQGYTTDTAASAEEALARLALQPYPVVLTDLHMPGGLTGLELIAAIRQRSPETLCVLITAHATLGTSIEALKGGAYDLIQKPFRLSEVEAVLDRTLDHARLLRKVHDYQAELETRILSRTQELQGAYGEALGLCHLTLQGLDAPSLHAALNPLLDRLGAHGAPDGVGLYRRDPDRTLRAILCRGARPLPEVLDLPDPGLGAPDPNLGYGEEHLVPLGSEGWLYLGFESRSAFSVTNPGFLLLTRHLELTLRIR